jgi:methionyl-tRNA formyltransferase
MKVIYMGSSNFSLEPLKALINSHHKVVAVFTSEANVLAKKNINPVYEFAHSCDIKVFTPKTLKSDASKKLLYSLDADVILVASYGLILPKEILECKKYGCINLHPSDLPLFRGAAPLHHTILSGSKESAVCVMQMDEGIDTGPILLKEHFTLPSNLYYQDLELLCSNIGAKLLCKVLDNIENIPKPLLQGDNNASYAHKIKKEDAKINWNDSADKIYNQIKAFHLWPGCYFNYKEETIKILRAHFEIKKHGFTPGYIIDDNFSIACSNGIIYPEILQRSGKKSLNIKDFLMGFTINRNVKAS